MNEKVKKMKSIFIKKNETINKIDKSGPLKSIKFKNQNIKYNLIIICAGTNSDLVKNIFKNNVIKYSYKEHSITTTLNHAPLKNFTARQFFFRRRHICFITNF